MATALRGAIHDAAGGRAAPGVEQVRAQLRRILADATFEASPARRALLRFVVEETLAGRADRLKGYAVAQAVFGRDDTFDPQADPVVRVEARRLRRDLDSYYATAGSGDSLRITIPKGAYAVTFHWHGEDGARAEERTLTPDADAMPTDRARTRLVAGLVGAVLVIVLAAGWFLGQVGRRDAGASGDEALRRGPTVIVLPFEVLSRVQDDHYLARGLTMELITDLMRFEGFRLYSAAASFREAERADPVALGRELDVAYVVKGTVASAAGRVRIGATLVDARTDEVLWSQSFERPLTPDNLLRLEDDLASRIASTLGQSYGIVNADAAGRLVRQAAPSMATYRCILRAYEYRRSFAVALHAPTVACLEAAVQRDPAYAEAWAMLAWLELDAVRFELAPADERERLRAEARAASARAVALDRASVRAQQVLAAVRFYDGDYEGSERAQRQALALNPNDPETLAQLGWRLAVRGRFDEGLPYLERAIDRSVSPPGWYFHLIAIHAFMQDDYAAALAAAERSGRHGSEVGLSLMAMSQAALGDRQAAERSLRMLEAEAPGFFADPEAVYRRHQATDEIVDALMAGLRRAGWRKPEAASG